MRSGVSSSSLTSSKSLPSTYRCASSNRFRIYANKKYDYVIVGGGSAGCLLANRLSADDNNQVLLLEAGSGKQSKEISVPAGISRLFKSKFDWNLYSKEQSQLDDRSIYVARGKVIGGSSSTNATLYIRGTRQDYDNWGIQGWSSDNALKWFLYAEDRVGPKSPFHSKGGLMHVEAPRYQNTLHGIMLGAAREIGINYNPDFNDWSRPQEGSGEFEVTQRKGVRADAYKQFLAPALKRENLEVISEAQVSKVIFENGTSRPRAVGVEYRKTGAELLKREVQLASNGEVILCSGAVHSPHLLLLSGIGPKHHLSSYGIQLIKDLPGVGLNLQDHPAVLSAYKLKPEFEHLAATNIFRKDGDVKRVILWEYILKKTGPLATTLCDRGAFFATEGHDQPNIQFRFNAGYALDPDGVSSYVKFGKLLRQGSYWPGGITSQVVACRPQSRGAITLASDDPLTPPKIDIGYLTDSSGTDIKTLREGSRSGTPLAKSPVFREEGFPGKDAKSDDQLDAYIRKTVHSANAVVGSCRMGSIPEDGSVVSPDLKVHGIDGLRIVDASVIPTIPGAQTGAATVMIAEKGSYMITHKKSASEC